ncbi:hypothetical protein EYF80_023157 [Liparis tanakae]|uniref:Uncharacterized protein n=1 Tax=Liparis tanakae TaxID=230148 RepID=A0A4Z2HNR0_9TELE|nr:hypothetical protein EYF80_023157 [Liparis tanakae]
MTYFKLQVWFLVRSRAVFPEVNLQAFDCRQTESNYEQQKLQNKLNKNLQQSGYNEQYKHQTDHNNSCYSHRDHQQANQCTAAEAEVLSQGAVGLLMGGNGDEGDMENKLGSVHTPSFFHPLPTTDDYSSPKSPEEGTAVLTSSSSCITLTLSAL